MKPLNLVVLIICCFTTSSLIAQTPKQIEDDLLKSFKKIDPGMNDNSEANDQFAKKLFNYASHHPATISYSFVSLKKEHLDINTSDDGLFRIYSWDTWSGGTMHFFENVFQYKVGAKTEAVLDTPNQEGDVRPNYYKLYTFKAGNNTYYLTIYLGIESSAATYHGVRVFSIINGKLNNEIMYGAMSNSYDDPRIVFDAPTKTIHIPVVTEKGRITKNYIIYKFTGQYFEKVKN